MRIAGYIEHSSFKITVFQYEGRFSVQFETPHYVQTFKIKNETGIDTLDKVKSIVTPEFIADVSDRFSGMHLQMTKALNPFQIDDEDTASYDVII